MGAVGASATPRLGNSFYFHQYFCTDIYVSSTFDNKKNQIYKVMIIVNKYKTKAIISNQGLATFWFISCHPCFLIPNVGPLIC